jgi:hypothetical protein
MPYKFNPFTGNLDLVDTNTAAGSDTQIQYNSSGVLAGSADLTWDDSGKELGVGGNVSTVGTMTADSFIPTSSTVPTNGVYLPSANNVAISTNGTGRLFVDANGNVGVGVSSPLGRFEVGAVAGNVTRGDLLVDSTSGSAVVTVGRLSSTGGDSTSFKIRNRVGAQIFLTDATTGNTAIGTDSSPSEQLTVKAPVSVDPFSVSGPSSEFLRITSDGKLGLGTSSVQEKLHVAGGKGSSIRLEYSDGGSTVGETAGSIYFYNGDLTAGTQRLAAAIKTINTDNTYGRFSRLGIFTANGETTEAERLTITNAGNVGIGTTGPLSILDVTVGANGTRRLLVNYDDSIITIKGSNQASNPEVLRLVADNIRFNTGTNGSGTEVARITSDGKLGLGTSSPTAPMHVKKADTSTTGLVDGIRLQQGNATTNNRLSLTFASLDNFTVAGVNGVFESHAGQDINTAGRLEFYTKASGSSITERMRIDSSGRVGIGTTSPQAILHTSKAHGATTVGTGLLLADTTAGGGAGTGVAIAARVVNNSVDTGKIEFMFNGGSDYPIVFKNWNGSTATERCRIDGSGRLLVGTTSTSANTTLLLQASSGGATFASVLNMCRGSVPVSDGTPLGVIDFSDSGHVSAASISALKDGSGTWTSGTSQPSRLTFSTTKDGQSSPTEAVRIDRDQLFYSAPSYNSTTAAAANLVVESTGKFRRSTSSAKYKTDIETLQDSYADALLSCRPVWYRSTCAGDNPDWGWWGFIAEEVAAVDPRLVHWKTVEVTYEEGSAVQTPCDPEPEGVAYDRFVPHLLNLIKRQGEAIAELQAEVTALKGA